MAQSEGIVGRGAGVNPAGRFERIVVQYDPALRDPNEPPPKTEFYWDDSQSILSKNNSPDLPFSYSINPYRGCEHGCSYCYARPYHEYLGLSAGLDFETKIFVKRNAAGLLRDALMKPSWQPQWISLSGVTDPYQPCEARFEVTRSLLQVMAEFRQACGLITKNALVTRDIDLLQDLARFDATGVTLSITTLDETLRRKLEPRTATAARRLAAVKALADAGVPVGVNVAPIIPGLNDHEIAGILQQARDHGASWAGHTIVRLPLSVAQVFEDWARREVPDAADKIMKRIRQARGGALNNADFATRMRGSGTRAEQITQMFQLARRRAGFPEQRMEFKVDNFRRPGDTRSLF